MPLGALTAISLALKRWNGQYLYISPENETVIVRTGIDEGIDTWIVPLYEIVTYTGAPVN